MSSENISPAFNTFQRIASQRSTFILGFVPLLNIVGTFLWQKKKEKKGENQILFYHIIHSHFLTHLLKCIVLIRVNFQVHNFKDDIHSKLLQFKLKLMSK